MKKFIKLIYLIFTAFLFACTSLTNGNRNFVDNQSTFVVGKDSNLKIENVDNTASIIGTTDNGKISIENYRGRNLENSDKLKIVGSSIGTSGVGFNYSNS
ncbi:hypothetical protein, partial [Fusobacterium necrophorum]|uniref:hypothetical protein n=1 Tax=Fusobacterium necrophorum TaxID=859 RepID=UPI00055D40C8